LINGDAVKVVGLGGTLREGSTSLGALGQALEAEEEAGAEVDLLDVRELALPMYEPGRAIEDYDGSGVARLVEALRGADAVILSTASYHGTIAGVTKNALDFAQFLARDERPFLDGRVVGLIATAGGERAPTSSIDAMTHAVHALHGIVAPRSVSIPRARRLTGENGRISDEEYASRLGSLGETVVSLASRLDERVAAGRA
jgi:FMN reductase